MDMKQLYTVDAHEEGTEICIKSPLDGKETDFYITVMGLDSKSYREAVRAYHRKLINKEEGGEIDLLVSVTKGWKGLEHNGKPVKFTAKVAKDLYYNSPNIASQLDSFVADRKNFIKG
tara:strand:+ start:1664 stop:2017 length:354 start_codon:yes stop_codon:yes gene_type:complete